MTKPGVVKFRFAEQGGQTHLTRKAMLSLKLLVSFKPTGAKKATVRTQRVTLTHPGAPRAATRTSESAAATEPGAGRGDTGTR